MRATSTSPKDYLDLPRGCAFCGNPNNHLIVQHRSCDVADASRYETKISDVVISIPTCVVPQTRVWGIPGVICEAQDDDEYLHRWR